MYSNTEKGGSYAIRGFNYQNTVSVYLLILNYNDESFFLVPEGEDDIEVFKEIDHYYLQVKSKRMTKSSFTKKEKGKDGEMKQNTLEKLIDKEKDPRFTKYKIVCTDISDELIDKKNPKIPNVFHEDNDVIYEFNRKVMEEGEVLPKVYIFMPGFKMKSTDRIRYLIGALAEKSISVDNGRGRNILNSLKELIDHKSEIPLHNEATYANKKISSGDIRSFFTVDKINQEMNEYYHELINSLTYPVGHKIAMKMLYNRFSFMESDDDYIKLREILYINDMLSKVHEFNDEYVHKCRTVLDGEINIIDNNEIDSKIIYCYLWEVLGYDN